MRLPCKRPKSAAVEHHSPTYPHSFQFWANILSFHSPYFLGKTGDNLAATNLPGKAYIPHFVCLQRGGIRAFKYKCDLFEVPSWPCRHARSHRRTGCGAITPKPQNCQWRRNTSDGASRNLMHRFVQKEAGEESNDQPWVYYFVK